MARKKKASRGVQFNLGSFGLGGGNKAKPVVVEEPQVVERKVSVLDDSLNWFIENYDGFIYPKAEPEAVAKYLTAANDIMDMVIDNSRYDVEYYMAPIGSIDSDRKAVRCDRKISFIYFSKRVIEKMKFARGSEPVVTIFEVWTNMSNVGTLDYYSNTVEFFKYVKKTREVFGWI